MSDFQTLVQGAFVSKALTNPNSWTQIGQASGTGSYANASINLTNLSPSQGDTVSIAISANSTTPNNDDIIETNVPLGVGGILTLNNVLVNEGDYLFVLATTGNIACRFSGIVQALQSMEALDAEILSLSADIEQFSAELASDVSNLQTEINAFEDTVNSDLANLSASIDQSFNTQNSYIDSLSATVGANFALKSALTTNVNNLQGEINNLSGSLQGNVNNLQNQINNLGNANFISYNSLQRGWNGSSGYVYLPNGFLIQGGYVGASGGCGWDVYNFPITFPNVVFSVVATDSIPSSRNHGNSTVFNNSQFGLSNSGSDGCGPTDGLYWMAIGY